jgi:hypothetical protein
MTLSIMTLSIMTLSKKGLFATFSMTTLWHYEECCHAMMNINMLSVIILNFAMQYVIMLSVMGP